MQVGRRRFLVTGASVAVGAMLGLSACTGPPPPERSGRPAATGPDAGELRAAAELASMTLEQRIASMLMLHTPGTDPAALRAFVERYRPGGFILMGDNVPGLAGLPAVTDALSPDPTMPLLIGIDQEGGDVRRIDEDVAAAADTLKSEPPEATETAFTARATMLAAAGCSVNFGIVADETADPTSFIYDRALGTSPDAAAARVAAAVRGERGAVLSTLKHFPGHGQAPGDSHSTVPSTSLGLEEWRASDAVPFAAGIDAGAEVVMFGHLVYSAVDPAPATLSSAWHAKLHDDLGFSGMTITDDMLMLQHTGLPEYQNPSENAIRAVAAGNTMLLYVLGADPSSTGVDPDVLIADIAAAVRSGRISEDVVAEAAHHLLRVRLGLPAMRPMSS
ncbi:MULTISPECIES: glycoside hydrolase family 3 N-terminal domain-containing protein [unclassified Plantibacter]|uniref:glycoside hydrolase family 3 N-terminal domain-containing protein n=1 Tax=unclassified Plantibacter TaxID=2624265 RepID=UPI0006F32049|nr:MULTISPECIES: glycoside hydrolase family 3 N-terminal domain-containing protein [unclassified Plantibacter]KQQ51424.1 glycosyl hydrolase family 3 [Plantibacter sp. Leaf314]